MTLVPSIVAAITFESLPDAPAIVILAPSYFAQLITFGVLIQVLNAFGRVEGALTFFIDRWTTIVDFQSVIKRLREFNKVLDEADNNAVT